MAGIRSDAAREELEILLQECAEKILFSKRSVDRAAALAEEALEALQRWQFANLGTEAVSALRAEDVNFPDAANLLKAAMDEDPVKLTVRPAERAVFVGQRRLHLTDTEYQILELLWLARPEVVPREKIIQSLYKERVPPSPRTVDVFVSHIRQKLKLAADGREFIEAARGQGWTLRDNFTTEDGEAASSRVGTGQGL